MTSPADKLPRRMFSRLRKLTSSPCSPLAAVCARARAATRTRRVTTGTYAGESGPNAPYLNVGPLIYEVQLSRQLNPTNSEDAGYLQGLTPARRKLEHRRRVVRGVHAGLQQHLRPACRPPTTSRSATPRATSTRRSRRLGTTPTPTAGVYVPGERPAAGSPTPPRHSARPQGALLLFKIRVVSLDNRPLELKIVDPERPAQTASAELDV